MKHLKTLPVLFFALQVFTGCDNSSTVSSENKPDTVTTKKDTTPRVEILDPEALKVLDSSTAVEILAKGFKWTEGPLYIADGDYLLFSDIPNNKIYKWKGGDTSMYIFPSGFTGINYRGKEAGSNGLLLNKKNELILLQHGDRRVAVMQASLDKPQSKFLTLADKYKGKKLNSPNDAVLAADGSLYFTDPPYGLADGLKDTAKQLPFQGVFLLRSDGKLELVTDEIKYPNGIALSPDGHFLYVANSDPENKIWMKYELNEKGLIKSKSIFYKAVSDEGKDTGSPDGMKINKAGYLFASGPGGIWLFNPAGSVIARVHTGQRTSNCAFGKDEKELFMTCDSYVMRLKLK